MTKPRKGTSLADFTRFEPLDVCVQETTRGEKENGGKTKNQTTENAVGQTVVDQKTNVWPV